MLRWDGPEIEDEGPEWVEGPNGHLVKRPGNEHPPPEPRSTEAHRRTRLFDSETGVLIQEIHEAVRTRFRQGPARKLVTTGGADPPVVWAVLMGASFHGAWWWMIISVGAFGPHTVLVLLPILLLPVLMGWKFVYIHTLLVWVIGSLFLAFDGYTGLAMMWVIAGFFAPGKWIRGQW